MINISVLNSQLRNRNIQTQVIVSFLLKAVSIFLSFFVVRHSLNFLGQDLFGIWIVILSLISWITMFDIGIGNGLRNKLTISLSQNDIDSAKSYITTAYFTLIVIAFALISFFIALVKYIDWGYIFNSTLIPNMVYIKIMLLFFISVMASFVLGLINSIFNAIQQNSLTNLIPIITNLLFLLMLWFYEKSSNDALLMLVLFYCSSLILSNILVTIFFFAKNRALIPQRHFFSKDKIIDILSLGGNFFIIQIAVLLIFTTDNFLILQLLGPKEVTVYNVVFKLFSTFNIVFGILISPIWSAFTEAYEKKDFVWIKSTLRRLKLVFVIILLGLIFMFFIYQDIINFWLPRNERIYPPFSLIVSLALFVAISVWNNIYSYFLNGVGEVIMQRKTAIIGAIVNIPLAIILVKYLDLGLTGIVYSMCACLFIFSIVGPIETFRFINKNNVK